MVVGEPAELAILSDQSAFRVVGVIEEETTEWGTGAALADMLVHPEARIIGRTVSEYAFRDIHGVDVIGVLRGEDRLDDPFRTELKAGDRILIAGPVSNIDAFAELNHDFVLLHLPTEREYVPLVPDKYLSSLAILVMMVVLSVSGLVPVVVAVLLAAIAAVLFRTISPERAYGAIHWSSIVLIAGMLPLADALQVTGGADLVADALISFVGDGSPRAMMGMLFFLTAAQGLVLSNTATSVLVAPISVTAAETMGVSPYPFVICVLLAASSAFSTPVSTPVVTLVVAPGGYRFADFLKIGLPLTVLVGVIAVAITPVFFPL
ncbi:SLC13 family permease [Ruegeria arenilitoris]|uniref:SLC13 family permease n=1 Tax=Ruegeria arenilitoris TaxID=1173585 RepID=UPI00147D6AE5|nr:SLC13 family permease [Ruegeria arenilitoris]